MPLGPRPLRLRGGEVWGLDVSHRERVEDQGVEEAMLPLGGSHLQLLGATGPDTTVGKFLERRGPGLHHIAYEVDDLEGALAELKEKGVLLIDEAPRRGGRGHMVAFVHPKGNRGLLVELDSAELPEDREPALERLMIALSTVTGEAGIGAHRLGVGPAGPGRDLRGALLADAGWPVGGTSAAPVFVSAGPVTPPEML